MWCLGQDVRHTEGNLLVRYGCRRVPRPDSCRGTSAYTQALPGGDLTLWGFGILVRLAGAEEGWFFDRTLQHPQRIQLAGLRWPFFEVDALGPTQIPQGPRERAAARDAAALLAAWFARYEGWVSEETPPGYRASLLRGRRRGAPCQSGHLPGAWRTLSQDIDASRSLSNRVDVTPRPSSRPHALRNLRITGSRPRFHDARPPASAPRRYVNPRTHRFRAPPLPSPSERRPS